MVSSVPASIRDRHSHWVGAQTIKGDVWIFDINYMCVGGWVPLFRKWECEVVPWILERCEPGADGAWNQTHVLEVVPRRFHP